MSKDKQPNKRKLPSVGEFFIIQKEPTKVVSQQVQPIDVKKVLENVTKQRKTIDVDLPQPLINRPQDVPIVDPQIVQGHKPLILPKVDEDKLVVHECHGYNLSVSEHVNFYDDLICEGAKKVPLIEDYTKTMQNNYVTVTSGLPWLEKGINYYGTLIEFKGMRAILSTKEFATAFINEYIETIIINALKLTPEDLNVYEVQPRKGVDTMTYFKKVFVLLSVMQQIDLFTNNVGRYRNNSSFSMIGFKTKSLDYSLVRASNATIGKGCQQHSTDVIYLNTNRMILVNQHNGKLYYFQVKQVGNKIYIITNEFKETNPDDGAVITLPSPEEAFLYVNPYCAYNTFCENAQNYLYTPSMAIPDGMKTQLAFEQIKIGRSVLPVKSCNFVDFIFSFNFPTAFVHREPGEEDNFYPIVFQGNKELQNFSINSLTDCLVFTTENWKLLENFLVTVLFPEQFDLPPPQGPFQFIDEELVDQVRPFEPNLYVEPQRMEEVEMPAVGFQQMDVIDINSTTNSEEEQSCTGNEIEK